VYLARFTYDVLPINRNRALELIRREVDVARGDGFEARLLVPLTRGQGGGALQFEIELTELDQLDTFRSDTKSATWMHSFSEILLSPPQVEILRVDQEPDPHST
jgi:hypothetical protein